MGLHAHLNCVFAHLTLLNQRFNLIDPKETEILGDLEAALLGKLLYAIAATDAVLIDADYAMSARDPETRLRFSVRTENFPSTRSIGSRVRLGKLSSLLSSYIECVKRGSRSLDQEKEAIYIKED